jgi:hypothetical protein
MRTRRARHPCRGYERDDSQAPTRRRGAAQASPRSGDSSRSHRQFPVDREPLVALLECSRSAALLVIGTSAAPLELNETVREVLLNVNAPTLIVPAP